MVTLSPAQTGESTSTVGPRPTKIWSDSGYFDIKNRLAVYTGHVRVEDPQLKLTCDKLTARTPEHGGRMDSVVGEGNVVVDMVDQNGVTNHATGDKLVYSYKVENSVTNDTAVLTGSPDRLPHVKTTQMEISGTKFTWDRTTGLIATENAQSTFQFETPSKTNTSAVLTNNVPVTTNTPPIAPPVVPMSVPPVQLKPLPQ